MGVTNVSSLTLLLLHADLFYSIFGLDVERYFLVTLLVSFFAAIIMSLAYQNVAFSVKATLLGKREINQSIKNPPNTDRRQFLADLRTQQVANTTAEATAFAVLYGNVLFLLTVIVGSFYVFSSAETVTNYVLSVAAGAAVTTLATGTVLIKH